MQSNILLKYLTWGLAEQTTLLSLYMRLGDSATWRPGNLVTPDHATLAKHLYAVQRYTEIFDSATRRPGDSPNIQPYLAFICDSAIWQPGNLATPDHATLAEHLYVVQHYTEIFDSAIRQPGNLGTRRTYNLT